jgi:glycine/serine hydroxymethyltransferase
VDETGISIDHNPPKILAKVGSNPHCASGKSATTTVIAAVSALGETIPPYVIFKGGCLSKEVRSDGILGTVYRSSPTGWSNSKLFLDFFQESFYTACISKALYTSL